MPPLHPHAVYFMCRERQLAYQMHLVAAQPGLNAWRPPPPSQPLIAPVLLRRGALPLSIRIPLPCTGVEPADEAVFYTGTVSVSCPKPACGDLPAAPPPAAKSFVAPAAQLQLRLATPPPAYEQPAKRSRTCSGGGCVDPRVAAQPCHGGAPWQQQQWPMAAPAVACPQPAAAYYPQQAYAPARVWAPLAMYYVPHRYVPQGPPAHPCSLGAPRFGGCSFAPASVQTCAGSGSDSLSCWLDKIRTLLSPASQMRLAIPTC